MTVQIKIPDVTFTDAGDLPVVRTDSILPAAGALFLADPTHPANPWPSGVPTNGATVPNLAWDQLAAVIGTGDEATLAADVYNVGLTATKGAVERTTKGGVHAIISPTYSFTDALDGFNIGFPQAIYDYLRANPTHKLYFSLWHRVTRAASDPTGAHKMLVCVTTNGTFALAYSQRTNFYGTPVDGSTAIDDTVGGNRYRNHAAPPGANFGTDPDNLSIQYPPGHRSAFMVGNRNNINGTADSGARRGKGGSRIFYRAYLEDLTVSGRTYAQVNAIDYERFTNICNTAGGRYYGDTFTDPATIP